MRCALKQDFFISNSNCGLSVNIAGEFSIPKRFLMGNEIRMIARQKSFFLKVQNFVLSISMNFMNHEDWEMLYLRTFMLLRYANNSNFKEEEF